ncbi:MAG: FkbM family methyltransferase [Candidatus Solibacter sp.]
MADHHPIIARFTPFIGTIPPYFFSDFLGSLISHEFIAGFVAPTLKPQVGTQPPPSFDEEYFEWIDLLEAVDEAKDSFTMVELGAGFGRWVVRGALAARQRGIPVRLAAVEAEPTVYQWMIKHFVINGLNPEDHLLLKGAVTEIPGEVRFNIGAPHGSPWEKDPNAWYGQHLTKDYDVANTTSVADGMYAGHPVTRHPSGWRSIGVPAVSLASILAKYGRIDLIDMDIEGEELPTVTANLPALNRQVKRLHIGTHGVEIEAGLRQALAANGWKCGADYSVFSKTETPFGEISFENGVQSWVNPRL